VLVFQQQAGQGLPAVVGHAGFSHAGFSISRIDSD